MKQGFVYLSNVLAGILTEDENGFTFCYDATFLQSDNAQAISLTLPLTEKPYQSNVLFPFFDGLIPEGWLLPISEQNKEINHCDRMSLLLAYCRDYKGVSIIPIENDQDHE
jgi:serine/threonine-protein kinase HipA